VNATAPEACVLCFHKQKTSARTRFLSYGASVLSGAPLPAHGLPRAATGAVRPHPVAALQAVEERLGLAGGSLRAEPEYSVEVDTPAGPVTVLLAEFTAVDPPLAAASAAGARFIALTEARGLPAVELELLRKAYELLIG
jgi:hypothetical protein